MNYKYNEFVNKQWGWGTVNTTPHLNELCYAALAMVSESGEAGDAVKKMIRGNPIEPKAILLECGDVLYYMTKVLELVGGYTLEDAITANIEKLEYRAKFGKETKGS